MAPCAPLALLATLGFLGGTAQDDVADVPSVELQAGANERMTYFLIGVDESAKPPKTGYRLVLVLPGGSGSAEMNPFVRRIYKNVLGEETVVAQLVATVWAEEQGKENVWPTAKTPWPGMEFSTEEFIHAVIADVEERVPLDRDRIYTLSWSSSGQAAYSYSLRPDGRVTGSFVAMSVFKPDFLPSLKEAKGEAYYLLHSPEDFIPIAMAEQAKEALEAKRAEVRLATYAGGHGWQGDVYGNMRAGFDWLDNNHAKAKKAKKVKRGKQSE